MKESRSNMALLVMDMQTAVIQNLQDYDEIVIKVARAINFSRSENIPVIFIKVQFRPGMPEIGETNKLFSASKQRTGSMDMTQMMKIDARLSPLNEEIVICKRRVSAFTGSDLEVILRANRIEHLILCGVATSGVVLSTLREAADKDYNITVISDCCTDSDNQIHELLMQKVFTVQAEVVELDNWMTTLKPVGR